jgi:hypothetical protein
MTYFMPNTFLFFFRCLLLSAFGFKKESMVIKDLFNKFSYRYTEVEQRSFLSPLRYLKASLSLLWKSKPSALTGNTKSFTFDLLKTFLEGDLEYLTGLGKQDTVFIFREQLYNESGSGSKIFNSLLLLLVFCIVLPVSVFSKDKAKTPLIMLELTEDQLLSGTLAKYGCEKFLIFSAFEKDIMFLSWFLQKFHAIRVSLIPSSNPISTLYKNVICDTFIFTAPYQKKEYEKLKANWMINKTELWPPYAFNAIKINKDPRLLPAGSIGLISSGMALREHLRHPSEYSKNDFLSEKDLVEGLKRYSDETGNTNIVIYLHPLEKSEKAHLDFSVNYYKTIFGPDVKFAPFQLPSKAAFDLCSIGISVYSSTQAERLYGGYKTIFAPMGYLSNFFSDERLDKISAQNYGELKGLIETLSRMSEMEFFDQYDLREYRWDFFNIPVNLGKPV